MTDPRSDGGTAVRDDLVAREDADATRSVGADDVDASRSVDADAASTVERVRRRVASGTRQVCALAATEVRLGLRRRWAAILVGLFAAFGLLVVAFGGSAPGPAGFERTLASVATLAVYVVPLAAVAYGYDAVVGPAERGWLDVLAALPVPRTRLLAATGLGRAVVLAGGVLLGLGIPGVALVAQYGGWTWPAVASVLLGATGLGLAFLAVAVALSTVAREATHALGAALLAWVWFVLVHDLLALGAIAAFDLPERAVAAAVLTNPAATYRVLVLDLLGAGGSAGFAGVLAATGLSTALLAVGLVAWILAPLAVAAAIVRRRGRVAAA